MTIELKELINSYQVAVISNEEAVKILMDLNLIIKEKEKKNKEILFEDDLKKKIRLLNVRTRVIMSQIDKKLKDI